MNVDDIFSIIEDILCYMKEGDNEECEVNQRLIGIKEIYKEFAVQLRKGSNFINQNMKD